MMFDKTFRTGVSNVCVFVKVGMFSAFRSYRRGKILWDVLV